MAITITAGAWAAGTTSVTVALPATPQAGDVHVIFVGAKPYNAVINVPAGWNLITGTDGANGTVANAIDLGSVVWKAFYRVWQSGDTNPAVSVTTGNVALGVAHRYRPSAGATINTPIGAKGSDTTSGTGYSITTDASLALAANDVISHFSVIAGNNATFATPTLSATGITFGTVTENPATEGTTASGNDLEASAATSTISAGTGTVTVTGGWTLSVAQTGGGAIVRIRETAPVGPTVTNQLMMMGCGA